MLDKKIIEKVIDKALSNGADFAEIFVENTLISSISFNDNKTKQNVVGNDYGAGVRVFYGHTAIYAFTNDLGEESLLAAADAVSKAATGGDIIAAIDLTKKEIQNIFLAGYCAICHDKYNDPIYRNFKESKKRFVEGMAEKCRKVENKNKWKKKFFLIFLKTFNILSTPFPG